MVRKQFYGQNGTYMGEDTEADFDNYDMKRIERERGDGTNSSVWGFPKKQEIVNDATRWNETYGNRKAQETDPIVSRQPVLKKKAKAKQKPKVYNKWKDTPVEMPDRDVEPAVDYSQVNYDPQNKFTKREHKFTGKFGELLDSAFSYFFSGWTAGEQRQYYQDENDAMSRKFNRPVAPKIPDRMGPPTPQNDFDYYRQFDPEHRYKNTPHVFDPNVSDTDGYFENWKRSWSGAEKDKWQADQAAWDKDQKAQQKSFPGNQTPRMKKTIEAQKKLDEENQKKHDARFKKPTEIPRRETKKQINPLRPTKDETEAQYTKRIAATDWVDAKGAPKIVDTSFIRANKKDVNMLNGLLATANAYAIKQATSSKITTDEFGGQQEWLSAIVTTAIKLVQLDNSYFLYKTYDESNQEYSNLNDTLAVLMKQYLATVHMMMTLMKQETQNPRIDKKAIFARDRAIFWVHYMAPVVKENLLALVQQQDRIFQDLSKTNPKGSLEKWSEMQQVFKEICDNMPNLEEAEIIPQRNQSWAHLRPIIENYFFAYKEKVDKEEGLHKNLLPIHQEWLQSTNQSEIKAELDGLKKKDMQTMQNMEQWNAVLSTVKELTAVVGGLVGGVKGPAGAYAGAAIGRAAAGVIGTAAMNSRFPNAPKTYATQDVNEAIYRTGNYLNDHLTQGRRKREDDENRELEGRVWGRAKKFELPHTLPSNSLFSSSSRFLLP